MLSVCWHLQLIDCILALSQAWLSFYLPRPPSLHEINDTEPNLFRSRWNYTPAIRTLTTLSRLSQSAARVTFSSEVHCTEQAAPLKSGFTHNIQQCTTAAFSQGLCFCCTAQHVYQSAPHSMDEQCSGGRHRRKAICPGCIGIGGGTFTPPLYDINGVNVLLCQPVTPWKC